MFVGALFFAAPAAAQGPALQSAPSAAAAAPAEPTQSGLTTAQLDRQRADVGTFEIALRRAVDRAVLDMAAWAHEIVPTVQLGQASEPVVHGVPVADASVTFTIEVSELLGVNLFQAYAQRPQQSSGNGVQRVGAQVVPGDPTTGPVPAPPGPPTSAAFNQHYSDFVRGAVIDTLLDQSGVLTLKDDQVLAVAVIPVSVTSVPGPRGRGQLILSIKGGDLNQLRQGKISRDEAKRRIVETHF
jgi:hypothetical protein